MILADPWHPTPPPPGGEGCEAFRTTPLGVALPGGDTDAALLFGRGLTPPLAQPAQGGGGEICIAVAEAAATTWQFLDAREEGIRIAEAAAVGEGLR